MALVKPQFEQIDQSGTTTCYNGNVDDTPLLLPPVADKCITSFIVLFPDDAIGTYASKRMKVSPDNSSCWVTICPDGGHAEKLRGCIKQIKIKSCDTTSLPYEVVINFESVSS